MKKNNLQRMQKIVNLKKRFITLLETLIALSLLTVLLVIIFSFFKEMTVISNLTEQKSQKSFQLRYLEARLAYFFERIVNEKSNDRHFYFYIDPVTNGQSALPSLVFTFNNEIRADPYFSGDVLARLYVDNEQQLCLATWPIHVEQPAQFMQKEVLMTNVENLSFECYSPPERLTSRNFITIDKVDPTQPLYNHWYKNEWRMVYKRMPAIIKISIIVKENQSKAIDWEFSFVLPSSHSFIYYPPS